MQVGLSMDHLHEGHLGEVTKRGEAVPSTNLPHPPFTPPLIPFSPCLVLIDFQKQNLHFTQTFLFTFFLNIYSIYLSTFVKIFCYRYLISFSVF